MSDKTEEKLPISEFYKVVDSVTIFKNKNWWEAIVVFESYGKRSIGMYLWQKRQDIWKKKTQIQRQKSGRMEQTQERRRTAHT